MHLILSIVTMTKSSDNVIYESPDQGKTVYSRKSGSLERTLIYESAELKAGRRWVRFKEIINLAENEPSLNDLLEKVEILYELLKKEKG